jgi:hypothetical protein
MYIDIDIDAGINDIFRRGDSKDIKQSLKELYDMARNHGSRVLAMTLLKVDRVRLGRYD